MHVSRCRVVVTLYRHLYRKSYAKHDKTFVWTRVSNGTGRCNFAGQRDRNSFIVPGQRDNGTTGQAKNLGKGRDGSGQPKSGTGRAGTAKKWDGTRNKTGQSRKGWSKTEKLCTKTEKNLLRLALAILWVTWGLVQWSSPVWTRKNYSCEGKLSWSWC